MMQNEQSVDSKSKFGIGAPLIIAELHLEHPIVEPLNHGPYLTANKPMLGHVHEQGDDVENVDGSGGRHGKNLRGDSSWSIAGSLRRSAQSSRTERPRTPSARRPLSLR